MARLIDKQCSVFNENVSIVSASVVATTDATTAAATTTTAATKSAQGPSFKRSTLEKHSATTTTALSSRYGEPSFKACSFAGAAPFSRLAI